MNKLGKKEIETALFNIPLIRNEYEAYEIDSLICEYYKADVVDFDDLTEKSHEFEYITDVYEYIDELLGKLGYVSEDMLHYVNVGTHINEVPDNQLSLFKGSDNNGSEENV